VLRRGWIQLASFPSASPTGRALIEFPTTVLSGNVDAWDAIGKIDVYTSIGSFSIQDGSILNLNANLDTTAGGASYSFGSTLILNGTLDLQSGALYTDGGEINQNSGDLIGEHLGLGGWGTATNFNRTVGIVSLNSLSLSSGNCIWRNYGLWGE